MHVKSHSISLFPIKTLQNLKTGNKPLNKIVTVKCITNIPEPWWCKWATSSIAEEGKISLPSFYFLPARSRDFPLAVWVQKCRVIRKNTSPGTEDALDINSNTITSCLSKFWLSIIQWRWNSIYEYFDVFWWIHSEPKLLMSYNSWMADFSPQFYFAQKHYVQSFVRIFLWPELLTNFSPFSLLVMLSRWKHEFTEHYFYSRK